MLQFADNAHHQGTMWVTSVTLVTITSIMVVVTPPLAKPQTPPSAPLTTTSLLQTPKSTCLATALALQGFTSCC